ncbi:MAG: toll/interleukin-1 receptor domain-containing protein [Anaerolineae bacterium]
MSKEYDIFLSYQSKDREWVRRLVDALSEQGLRVWYDEKEVRPGEPILHRMEEGLRGSAHVVFVITPQTARSNWMAAELGAALALQKSVIPVVSEDTPSEDIPGPIKLRKYLLKGDPEVVAEEIVRGIASEHKGKDKISA